MRKAILGIIIVIIIALIAWYFVGRSQGTGAPDTNAGTVQTNGTESQQTESTALPGGSDSSDAALNADMQAVDTSVNSSANASQSAQSFDDQPVQQSY